MYTHSPKKPKIVKKRCLPVTKLMATVFWDKKEVLMMGSLRREHKKFRYVLRNAIELRRAIQNRRHGMLTHCALRLHDNARLHTAVSIRALLEHFN
jgi:hypothetical protein